MELNERTSTSKESVQNANWKRKFFISKVHNELKEKLQESLMWMDWERIVHPDSRIFVKPNLTFPSYKPGVTVSPEFLETLIGTLKTRCNRIIVGETDGGYYTWKAGEAFQGHRLDEICKKYDVELVNLSEVEAERVVLDLSSEKVEIPLPALLLHEVDTFVTVPVPKVHAMTGVSLGLKNQWGCIADPMRLRYHHLFNKMIVAINKLLRPAMVIADATYMLDINGPMFGEPVRMDLIMAGNDIGSFDLTTCMIMGIDPRKISHLMWARREGLLPASVDEVSINTDLDWFYRKFHLKRTAQNWMAFLAFNSHFLTRLVYDSPTAGPIHTLLYAIRGKPTERSAY